MFKNKNIIKNNKWIMRIVIILGLCLILISKLDASWINKGYTAGLGGGLIFAAVINLIVIGFKQKNAAYEEEVEIQMQDERVKLNKMRALAYAGVVMITAMVISSTLHAYMDFDIQIGNIVVLFSYVISLAGFKWFYRNK